MRRCEFFGKPKRAKRAKRGIYDAPGGGGKKFWQNIIIHYDPRFFITMWRGIASRDKAQRGKTHHDPK